MRLSTVSRYGSRAMVELAVCQEKGKSRTNLRKIADRQEVSYRYLEQIMLKLRARGLVRSIRGSGGGFALARPASQITFAEVVDALEGRISVVECTGDSSICHRSSFCVTREVWGELADAIDSRLSALTIEDLAERQRRMTQVGAAAYSI